jgi:Tfp pilus assembly protein PilP
MTLDYGFIDSIQDRRDIATTVTSAVTVNELETALNALGSEWWEESWPLLLSVREGEMLPPVLEASLLESLREMMSGNSILNRYEIAGVFARWWFEIRWDLHSLRQNSAEGVIAGWVESFLATLQQEKETKELPLSPVELGVRDRLLPDYAARLAAALLSEADANARIQTREYGDDWGAMTPADRKLEVTSSGQRALQKRISKAERKPLNDYNVAMLRGSGIRSGTSIAKLRKDGNDVEADRAQTRVGENAERITAIDVDIAEIQEWQDQHKALTEERTAAKALVKELKSEDWIEESLKAAAGELSEDAAAEIVCQIMGDLFQSQLDTEIRARRDKCIAYLESCWDRYRTHLRDIEAEVAESKGALDEHLEVLGYD